MTKEELEIQDKLGTLNEYAFAVYTETFKTPYVVYIKTFESLKFAQGLVLRTFFKNITHYSRVPSEYTLHYTREVALKLMDAGQFSDGRGSGYYQRLKLEQTNNYIMLIYFYVPTKKNSQL